tara:strand:- start:6884 stop:8362 length:1479 start_codon:yes stop_codon:yes gene_type:complete
LKKERDIYDLIIIGGGVSASFLCLSIYKLNPSFKILIIEKNSDFPRKIGESLVDLASIYVKSLGIKHILDKHTTKTGVRFLFNETNSSDKESIAEFASPTLPGLIQGYHLDRGRFDQELLDEVEEKGTVVFRPADIINSSFSDFNNELDIEVSGEIKLVKSNWIVDATGRSRFIPNKLNWKDKSINLNTGAIMAHFTDIASDKLWDTKNNEYWDKHSIGLRKYSTTHLMRKNSWWWIIQLDDKNTSIGVVFDKNKIEFDDYEKHFRELLENDNQLSIITKNAECGEIKHIESLPYVCEKIHTRGIALLGESGAFLDPLISPGMELIGQQNIWLAELLTKEKESGKFDSFGWRKYSNTFFKAYDSRLSIYETAYNFIHSYDIFSTWIKQGNYVYFGWVVYPAVIFKTRLKYPLSFNLIERIALKYFKRRFTAINKKRENQKRTSKVKPNTISYSSVWVPDNLYFLIIPFYLLLKSFWAYIRLEFTELKHLQKK